MRLHRFFVDQTIGMQTNIVVNSTELVNQVRRVFRLKTGDEVVLFDGSGSDYVCRIEDLGQNEAHFGVVQSQKSRFMPNREIILAAAVVKKDTFEWIAQKATELGVSRIAPIISERSEKKNLNEERLKKIIIEASEQCGRGDITVLDAVKPLNEFINSTTPNGDKPIQMVFHIDGQPFNVKEVSPNKPLVIFIGPEGGWSEKELEMFKSKNIPVVSLGGQVLRAETAAVAILAQFVF